MSNTLRTTLGAIVFTVAVIFFINYAGNMMVHSGAKSNPPEILKAQLGTQKKAPKKARKKLKSAAEIQAKIAAIANSKTKAGGMVKPKPKPVAVAARTVDPTKGYQTFKRKCLGCHTVNKDAPNQTGPNLWGVVGRAKGSKAGFRYSKGLKRLGGVWTEADINRFIAGPRSMVSDTKMTFRGLKTRADRMDIIAFFKTLKN